MRVREHHSLARQAVQVRGAPEAGRVQVRDVPDAHIVGEDEQDVRAFRRRGRCGPQRGQAGEEDEGGQAQAGGHRAGWLQLILSRARKGVRPVRYTLWPSHLGKAPRIWV